MRLTRTNNTFTAFYSPDGNAWTQIGSPTTVGMAVGAYVGLAVCAHNNAALSTSVIDNASASFLTPSTAPVLNPISNQTVNVGQTVAVTASAKDTDSPPPTLTFTLLSGPPPATLNQINATNAAFTWRPMVSDANTSQTISLKVSADGLPSLSATQSFTAIVNPLTAPMIESVMASNRQFSLQLNGETGPDYAVQVSTNLLDWTTLLITNSPAMPWQWTATNQANFPAQFYRIKTGPPLP